MKPKSPEQAQKPDSLVGHYFHSLNKEGEIQWQGFVVSRPEPGLYLVQLYAWLMGEPNVEHLVHIDDMRNWIFYHSGDAMQFSYEHGVARAGGQYRKARRTNT